jgi:predicted esterase
LLLEICAYPEPICQGYTRFVKLPGLAFAILFYATCCFGQAASPVAPVEKLPAGQVIERVVCAKNSEESYALYVPSHYSPDRAWPVVFVFDPGARGKLPVDLMKEGAERYDYIVLGSNNSRNGAWKPEMDAADAMLQDAQLRFNVDLKRIYFAGLSGGARVASQLAQLCKCSAGVLLSGAGFSRNSPPLKETAFPVFSAVGNQDFNYSELIPLQEQLERSGYPHWLRVFEGVHEWAPAEVMSEALAWFRVQAMREKRAALDENFAAAELKARADVAEKYAVSGDALGAWRQYKQIAETFEGVADVAAFRAKAEELGRGKAMQDGLKRERNELAEQERMSNQILGALQSQENLEAARSAEQRNVTEDVRDLRQRSESEKKPERAVVLKRALAGVFIGAIESGSDALEKKEYGAAARYFAAAAEARPSSEWPFRQLAIAQALSKDRKSAVETLRRIKPADRNEFARWLADQKAFDEMRARGELAGISQ